MDLVMGWLTFFLLMAVVVYLAKLVYIEKVIKRNYEYIPPQAVIGFGTVLAIFGAFVWKAVWIFGPLGVGVYYAYNKLFVPWAEKARK